VYSINSDDADADNKNNNNTFEDVSAYFPEPWAGTVLGIVRLGSLPYV
jgi:hypothetical protein